MLIIASGLIACAFPAKFILEVYLTKYIDSAKVIFYLFAAQLFYIVIKSIYVNLYKALHRQRTYFTRLVMIIAIGFALNVICYQILHTKEAFAIGTLLSAFIWFVFSVYDFKEYSLNIHQILYIIVCLTTFFICGYALEVIIGFIIYAILAIMAAMLLMKEDFIFVIQYLWDMIRLNKFKE
jgi:O-antigen/teichoic acid export membrane protein